MEILECLGEGTFAIVLRVRTQNKEFACKVFNSNVDPDADRDEISVMLKLSQNCLPHTPIVKIHGYHIGHDSLGDPSYILMDLCAGGNLRDFMNKRGTLTEVEAAVVIKTVAVGLQYCHSKGVLHRDVKPENIFIDQEGQLESVRLGDFGVSMELHADKNIVFGITGVGSDGYIAPEVENFGFYSPAMDVWSLGAVLLEMLTGEVPPSSFTHVKDIYNISVSFIGVEDMEVDSNTSGNEDANVHCHGDSVNHALAEKRWQMLSPPVQHLISALLEPDPNRRITLQQVLNHPWLVVQSSHQQNPWFYLDHGQNSSCIPVSGYGLQPGVVAMDQTCKAAPLLTGY